MDEKIDKILRKRLKELDELGETRLDNPSMYMCKHCNKIVGRESSKQWIKSYCEETGKVVHLKLIYKRIGKP